MAEDMTEATVAGEADMVAEGAMATAVAMEGDVEDTVEVVAGMVAVGTAAGAAGAAATPVKLQMQNPKAACGWGCLKFNVCEINAWGMEWPMFFYLPVFWC